VSRGRLGYAKRYGVDPDLKAKALYLHEEKWTLTEIARAVDRSISTVHRWLAVTRKPLPHERPEPEGPVSSVRWRCDCLRLNEQVPCPSCGYRPTWIDA